MANKILQNIAKMANQKEKYIAKMAKMSLNNRQKRQLFQTAFENTIKCDLFQTALEIIIKNTVFFKSSLK